MILRLQFFSVFYSHILYSLCPLDSMASKQPFLAWSFIPCVYLPIILNVWHVKWNFDRFEINRPSIYRIVLCVLCVCVCVFVCVRVCASVHASFIYYMASIVFISIGVQFNLLAPLIAHRSHFYSMRDPSLISKISYSIYYCAKDYKLRRRIVC